MILEAQGERRSAVETAEGDKESNIIRAQGEKQAQVLEAQGDSVSTVLRARSAESMGERAVSVGGFACRILIGVWRLVDLLVKLAIDGENRSYAPRVDANQFLTVTKQCDGLDPPD